MSKLENVQVKRLSGRGSEFEILEKFLKVSETFRRRGWNLGKRLLFDKYSKISASKDY